MLADANVAQLVEQLIRNQQVRGSSPLIGSTLYRGVAQFGSAFGSGPKGRRFKSCHLDQKKPETERFPVLFLSLLHKAPSLALFSCNRCATLGKGPKTQVGYSSVLNYHCIKMPPPCPIGIMAVANSRTVANNYLRSFSIFLSVFSEARAILS